MTDEPKWWVGTNYEVLDPILSDDRSESLQATFTPNNGIRLTILNDDIDGYIATFDFSPNQAKFIGAKLIEWGTKGHG